MFDSIEKMSIITNAYIPDWTPEAFGRRIRYKDQYHTNIYSILCEFANSEKKTIEFSL